MAEYREYILAIINHFVVREKQERFTGFIESRREELLDELFIDERNLNPEALIKIPRGKSATFVINDLKRIGANGLAYVMSHNEDFDGRLLKLEDAIESVFGRHSGALIYCVNSKFGYYEDSEMSKYILRAA